MLTLQRARADCAVQAPHPARPLPPPPPALTQATALATIGKFVVKKKVGENDAIFGSVTAQELVDAIRMQVGHVSGGALTSQRVNAAGRGAPRAGVLQWRRLRCAGSSEVEHARGAGPASGRCWQAACLAGMTAMAAVAAFLVLAMSWQLLLCQRKNGQSSGQKQQPASAPKASTAQELTLELSLAMWLSATAVSRLGANLARPLQSIPADWS